MTTDDGGSCYRRGCDELWTKIVSTGTGHYFTRLCKAHEVELKERAKILGGYSMVNAEDSEWRHGDEAPDNAWGWKLDA